MNLHNEITRYWGDLFRMSRRLSGYDDERARELLGDALVIATTHADHYDPLKSASVKTWLTQAVILAYKRRGRTECNQKMGLGSKVSLQTYERDEHGEHGLPLPAALISDERDQRAMEVDVQAALATLTPVQRRVFERVVFEGYSIKSGELEEEFGWKPAYLYIILAKAKALLAQHLGEYEPQRGHRGGHPGDDTTSPDSPSDVDTPAAQADCASVQETPRRTPTWHLQDGPTQPYREGETIPWASERPDIYTAQQIEEPCGGTHYE